jgi:hypothetical protein
VARMLKNGLEIMELDLEMNIFYLLGKTARKIGLKKYL